MKGVGTLLKLHFKLIPNQQPTQTYRRFYILGILIVFTVFSVSVYSAPNKTDNPPNWYFNIQPGEVLNLNPVNTQWLMLDQKLTAATIDQEKLQFFTSDKNANWIEKQTIQPSEANVSFTTFVTRDINGDGIPEIFTGTTDPGYIYMYKYSDGKYTLSNSEKYVWSTITSIAVGNFDGQQFNILVQNQDGFLYLLKINNDSFDIIWKSPTVWRMINSMLVLDLDNDSKEEIIVCFKTGGIGILKLVNNQIISSWDNYLWGKVLVLTNGDWDNDKQDELLISTSQKVIYVLGFNGKNYQFEDRLTQLNYIAETLSIFKDKDHSNNLLLTTDTAGKFHYALFDLKAKQWQEQFFCQTGRIAQIIKTTDNDSVLLWTQNHQMNKLTAFKTSDFKLKTQDSIFSLSLSAIYQNNLLYLAPKALSAISQLGVNYTENKTVCSVVKGDITIEVNKNDLTCFILNGESQSNQDQWFILIDNNLYLSDQALRKLLNLNPTIDINQKLIEI